MKTVLTVKDQVKVVEDGNIHKGRILEVLDNAVVVVEPFDKAAVDAAENFPKGDATPAVKTDRIKKLKKAREDDEAKNGPEVGQGIHVPHASSVPVDESGSKTTVWYVFGRGEKVTQDGETLTIEHDHIKP